MTLARQLLLGIAFAFAPLLVGIETIYVRTARHYLANQLDASANEAATSLAMSIGARMQTLDPSLVNTIVNPVFDRGYFRRIEVRATDGTPVFSRQLEAVEVSQPPAWFITIGGFDPPVARSLVSSGWKQLGSVFVEPHPQFAYNQLWDTALATLAWLALLSAVGLVGIRIYLAGILRPLKRIEAAAVAIGEHRFVAIDTIPKARELQRVTAAINSLSAKMRDTIAREGDKAERLRREAFEDPMTGRLNRRGFEAAASAALAETDVFSGALVLLSLEGLDNLNRVSGIARGNEILRQLSESLQFSNPAGGRVLVGRWQGAVFAVFAENADGPSLQRWAEALAERHRGSLREAGTLAPLTLRAGVAHYAGSRMTLSPLIHLAEGALSTAAREGAVTHLTERSSERPANDVLQSIEAALSSGRISILFQTVLSIPDKRVLQYELFSRIVDRDGQQIPATIFLPVAAQNRLLPALDRYAIELAVGVIEKSTELPQTLSINVSLPSLVDETFRAWICSLLEGHPAAARRLVFEISSSAAALSRAAVKQFSLQLRGLGGRFALDNFEMSRDALAVAHDVMPAYLKLAPAYTREVGIRDDARFTLEAMLRAIRPLDIPVYAQGVEDAELLPSLAEIGITGYQGFAIGRPATLPGV